MLTQNHGEYSHLDNMVITVIVFSFGWICDLMQCISAEAIYTWTFRILSLISIGLVIIINWRKAKEALRKKTNGKS